MKFPKSNATSLDPHRHRGRILAREASTSSGGRERDAGRRARPRCRRRCAPRRAPGPRPRRSVTRRPRSRRPRIAASLQTSVATPKSDDLVRVERIERARSAFGFVNTSKFFFRSRISRRPSISSAARPGGNGTSASGSGSSCSVSGIFSRAARAAQAVRRVGVAEVGLVGDLRIGQLVVVGGGDVDEPAARAARRRAAPSRARSPRRRGRRASRPGA